MLALILAGQALSARSLDGQPAFLAESLYPSNAAVIEKIVEAADADIVILSNGLLEGFVTGQICVVFQDDAPVGEIIVTDSFFGFSVGLITALSPDVTLIPGNPIRVKTL